MKHGAEVKRCSAEGCTNLVQKGGVCRRHERFQGICDGRSDGFTNQSQQGGAELCAEV